MPATRRSPASSVLLAVLLALLAALAVPALGAPAQAEPGSAAATAPLDEDPAAALQQAEAFAAGELGAGPLAGLAGLPGFGRAGGRAPPERRGRRHPGAA